LTTDMTAYLCPDGFDQDAAVAAGELVFCVLDHQGDTKYHFNPRDPGEVTAAREFFTARRREGWTLYREEGEGRGTVLTEFDPAAGVMIGVPPVKGG
jgi:hypothetical protein